jgi:hypothetical protein
VKRILEFTFPEDKEEYEMAVKGPIYNLMWTELDEFIRSKRKYENKKSISIDELTKFIVQLENDYLNGE